MQFDSAGLTAFYDSPMGQVTRRSIHRRLKAAWPDIKGTRVLGFGFAAPYLRTFALDAERVIAALPDGLGPLCWPRDRSRSRASSSALASDGPSRSSLRCASY